MDGDGLTDVIAGQHGLYLGSAMDLFTVAVALASGFAVDLARSGEWVGLGSRMVVVKRRRRPKRS